MIDGKEVQNGDGFVPMYELETATFVVVPGRADSMTLAQNPEILDNFISVFDKKLMRPDGSDDFNAFTSLFRNSFPNQDYNPNLLSSDQVDLLAHFFKEPNGGNPWKLGWTNSPASPHPGVGKAVRGRLLEYDIVQHGDYQGFRYLDFEQQRNIQGIDYRSNDGNLFVQETSTQLTYTNASNTLTEKLNNLGNYLDLHGDPGSIGIFAVRIPPNGNTQEFRNALEQLAATVEAQRQLPPGSILIDVDSYAEIWTSN